MASTGEVAAFGESKHEAFLKALLASGFKIPNPRDRGNILLSCGPIKSKVGFLDSAKDLVRMGYKLFASHGTYTFLKAESVPATLLHKPSSGDSPSIVEYLKSNVLHLVVNIPD